MTVLAIENVPAKKLAKVGLFVPALKKVIRQNENPLYYIPLEYMPRSRDNNWWDMYVNTKSGWNYQQLNNYWDNSRIWQYVTGRSAGTTEQYKFLDQWNEAGLIINYAWSANWVTSGKGSNGSANVFGYNTNGQQILATGCGNACRTSTGVRRWPCADPCAPSR